MTVEQFIDAVNNLVKKWHPTDEQAGATPRNALATIYQQVREQAVHDLAQAIQQRDKAIERLHKHYIEK